MWQRNNGQAEDDLQFRFTAYLVSAVKRRRKDYLIQLYKRSSIESAVEAVYESEPSSEEVALDRLPLLGSFSFASFHGFVIVVADTSLQLVRNFT